jgi:membrane-associated phospholipid phosphatase
VVALAWSHMQAINIKRLEVTNAARRLLGGASLLLLYSALHKPISALLPKTIRPIPGTVLDLSEGKVFVREPSIDLPYIPGDEMTFNPPAQALLLIAIAASFIGAAWTRREATLALSTMCWSMLLNLMVTDVLKNYTGVLRPNFYAGCGWSDEERRCTKEFHAGRHAFPSGHSAAAAVLAHGLALYLLRVSRLADPRGALLMRAAAIVPWLLALWVASSRLVDYYHHPADVVAGVAIGAICAWSAFGAHFTLPGGGEHAFVVQGEIL